MQPQEIDRDSHDSGHSPGFEPPDGGAKAWACVVGSFLLQLCSFGYVNACGIFQYHYQVSLLPDQSTSNLAWITTLQVFLLFMFGPAIGKLIDVFGSRKIIAPFSVLAIFTICMLSLCTTYWQVMLAQGVGFGFASSGLSLPAMALATQWFSSKRGLAVGIASSGSSMGGVIYPFMIPRLIRSVGFASAVRWTALMQGILLVIANILCSTPFPPKGLQKKEKKEKKEEDRNAASKRASISLPWVVFILGCFFTMWGLFAPLNYLPEMAAVSGMGTDLAQYTLAIANAGSVLGRVVPGWASDRLGQFNVMSIVMTISGVLTLAMWLPLWYYPSNAGIIVFALLYGFSSGGFVSLGPPCVVALADGRVEDIGVKLGGFCLAIALGALTGLPIAGAIRDSHNGSFSGLIIFAGATILLGGFFSGAARVLRGGWSLSKKV